MVRYPNWKLAYLCGPYQVLKYPDRRQGDSHAGQRQCNTGAVPPPHHDRNGSQAYFASDIPTVHTRPSSRILLPDRPDLHVHYNSNGILFMRFGLYLSKCRLQALVSLRDVIVVSWSSFVSSSHVATISTFN